MRILTFLLLFLPLFAGGQMMFFTQSPPTGASHHAWVEAWTAEIVSQGGTVPSEYQLLLLDTLANTIDTAGINFDGFYVFAQDGSQKAGEVNFVGPGGTFDLTSVDSPEWASNEGYKPRENELSGGHYDANNTLSTMTHWTTNDHCFGYMLDTLYSGSGNRYIFCSFYSSGGYAATYAGAVVYSMRDGSATAGTSFSNAGNTIMLVNRTSSSSVTLYQDNAVNSTSSAAGADLNYSQAIGAMRNTDSWASYYSANAAGCYMRFAWFGESLTSSQRSTLQTALNAYVDGL